MLRNLSNLNKFTVSAADGEIGSVKDFYFDDTFWKLRYLVVDLGNWLAGREVLMSPHAFNAVGISSIGTALTVSEIEKSPGTETQKPITRHYEEQLHKYYAWPYYWDYDATSHPDRSRENKAPREAQSETPDEEIKGDVPSAVSSEVHLQSFLDTKGFRIQAPDGDIGHLSDFILDDTTWGLPYAVFDTRNWLHGKHILYITKNIDHMDWNVNRILVKTPKDTIRLAPSYNDSNPITKEYELTIHKHYDIKPYWI